MRGPLFYAKILLFGEYGIIKDSKGLSIPYNHFKGGLKNFQSASKEAEVSNNEILKFSNYLKTLEAGLVQFDFEKLEEDLKNGLHFDSSIPQGYGVGSSGALVAAIYERYAKDKITILENLTREKLLTLKEVFSAMESYFHGNSSGLDPLNSYLSLPILIHSKTHITPTGIPNQGLGKRAVFLLDSGMAGETAPMVKIFLENMKETAFQNMLQNKFIKLTDACVDNFLSGNIKGLFKNTKSLSKVVLGHFKPMIPAQFQQLWKQGIQTNDYYLKLCGSGGGGYFLGFTEDIDRAKLRLKDYRIEVVYQF
jgi:mevalonate kinase